MIDKRRDIWKLVGNGLRLRSCAEVLPARSRRKFKCEVTVQRADKESEI